MNMIKVSLDKARMTEYDERYMKTAEGWLFDYVCSYQIKELYSFFDSIGQQGQIFCPATLKKGKKDKKVFEQMQLFALYFDKGNVTFEEILERASRYGIPVMCAYDTFSDDKETKFTLVMINETPIYSLAEAEAMQAALMTIFPEANKNCENIFNTYFGGNNILYLSKRLIKMNAYFLFMGMSFYLKEEKGNTNYKRELIKFSKKYGIVLNLKKLPDILVLENQAEKFDKISPKSTINNTSNGNKLSKLIYKVNISKSNTSSISNNYLFNKTYKKESISSINIVSNNNTKDNTDLVLAENLTYQKNGSKHKMYRSDDLKYFQTNCQLYRDFFEGHKSFSENQLLGMASNLLHVESGENVFLDFLKLNVHFENDKRFLDRWKYNLSYIKDGFVSPCYSFCPYHNKCPHGRDMLSTVKIKYHQMEPVENYNPEYVDIDEAWLDFVDNFWVAVESEEKIWHILKCQTALGKTEAVIKLLKEKGLRVLIAAPTNKLKREICERAKAMGIDIVVSPSLHEILDELPDEVACEIEALYNSGKSPMAYVNKLISEEDPRCTKILKNFKKEMEEFLKSEGHAVTTHRRLSSLDLSKFDLVIVDEDIIYSTVIPNKETLTIADLKKLKTKLAKTDPLAVKIRGILRKIREEKYFKQKRIKYDKRYDDLKTYMNIPALCEAKHFCYRNEADREDENNEELYKEECISFMRPVKFRENTKYIMLSATANENVCNYYFGKNNVKFYESKEARIVGNLIQYYNRTMSRSYIGKQLKKYNLYAKLKEKISADDIITFQRFEKTAKTEWHFGNCVGCDVLKGKDIIVIGTPHQPEWIYKLFAYSVGFKADEKAKNLGVVHNGQHFHFNTFENEQLREIQFYMIESELEQAVGRARLLRCDCTVTVFSNFPLNQSDKQEFAFLEEESEDKK